MIYRPEDGSKLKKLGEVSQYTDTREGDLPPDAGKGEMPNPEVTGTPGKYTWEHDYGCKRNFCSYGSQASTWLTRRSWPSQSIASQQGWRHAAVWNYPASYHGDWIFILKEQGMQLRMEFQIKAWTEFNLT